MRAASSSSGVFARRTSQCSAIGMDGLGRLAERCIDRRLDLPRRTYADGCYPVTNPPGDFLEEVRCIGLNHARFHGLASEGGTAEVRGDSACVLSDHPYVGVSLAHGDLSYVSGRHVSVGLHQLYYLGPAQSVPAPEDGLDGCPVVRRPGLFVLAGGLDSPLPGERSGSGRPS